MSDATNNQRASSAVRAPPPAFDPERPQMVQPWREFEGRGWVSVHYDGGSITKSVYVKLLSTQLMDPHETAKYEAGEDIKVGPSEAKDRIVKANLWAPKGKKGGSGKKPAEELPKRSLCKKDFDGNDQSLYSRARSIANTLGERTAAGRIGSMTLTLKGMDTLGKWWAAADPDKKARILSDKKHFDTMTHEDKERLNTVLADCPFRADTAVPTEAQEESKSSPAPAPKAKAVAESSANGARNNQQQSGGKSSKGKQAVAGTPKKN